MVDNFDAFPNYLLLLFPLPFFLLLSPLSLLFLCQEEMPARGLGLGQASVQGCVVVTVAALSKAHSNSDGIDFNEVENVRRCKEGVSLFFQHCNSSSNRTAASSDNRTRSKNKNKTASTSSSLPLHPALVNAALQVCSY